MKKNLNMNIAGQIFHIDEDAYSLLENYLRSLQAHFGNSSEDKELMSDFESRIAELLVEMGSSDSRIVDISLVRQVIERIGKPEEIFAEEQKETYEHRENRKETFTNSNGQTANRKYYRDVDNAWLCGVLSGLAAYTGWNLGVLRLLAVLLTLFASGFFWVIILGYLACWMIVPAAITADQKLQMRGEPVTVEQIGREVTDDPRYSHSQDNSMNRMGGCLLRGCLGTLVLILVIPAIFIIIALIGGFFEGLTDFSFFYYPHFIHGDSWMFVTAIICGIIIIAVPVIVLIHSIIQTAKPATKPLPKWFRILSMILWVLSIIMLIVLFILYIPNLRHELPFINTYLYQGI
ncbi:PspC domain-containing protein [Porphyromonas macacae]|uniref:PspC domain-containing protein n=1 Tax=Porphyromonas macacae TaxID=28115 RepID=UPI000690286A|nr:PspC domain-containing protein [Porphyromonas macacae]